MKTKSKSFGANIGSHGPDPALFATHVAVTRRMGIGFALLVFLPAVLMAQTDCNAGAGPLKPDPPQGITTDEIIKKFAQQESVFAQARLHYTFTQDVTVQTIESDMPTGEYRQVVKVAFDEHGKRLETVSFSPQSTLVNVSLTREDFDDINRSPFILTTENLPQYNLQYSGQQKVDELDTYLFEVAPRQMEKDKRYFQGKVWVESHDLQIVKTCGKSVPDFIPPPDAGKKKKKKNQPQENLTPVFVSYRQQFEDKYWFPVYLRADETLHFAAADVHIREVVRFENYQPAGPASGSKSGTMLKPQQR